MTAATDHATRHDFAWTPGNGQDMHFHPADPTTARTLTADQVTHFNERGYVPAQRVFDEAATERWSAYMGDLIDTVVAADDRRNSYSVNSYQLVCAGVWDLIHTPAILDLVEDLLGPDIVAWSSHAFCKLPGDTKVVPLHQDAIYWPLSATKTVTAWLSLDGADEENGAMEFAPGSHLAGPLEHTALELDGTRVLKRTVAEPDRFPERVINEVPAGHVSLHADLLLHGSGPNRSSTRRRTAFTIRYAAADIDVLPAYADYWKFSATHCRGNVGDHWPNRRRPDGEHPERMASFTGEFDGNLPDAG